MNSRSLLSYNEFGSLIKVERMRDTETPRALKKIENKFDNL